MGGSPPPHHFSNGPSFRRGVALKSARSMTVSPRMSAVISNSVTKQRFLQASVTRHRGQHIFLGTLRSRVWRIQELSLLSWAYLYGGRDRICIQTAFDGKTYIYMTRGKSASCSRVTRFARPGNRTTRVTLLHEMSDKAPYKHFLPGQLSATSL